MLALPGIALGVAILLFSGMVILVSHEQRAQKRVVLSGVRRWFDRVLDMLIAFVKRVVKTVSISIVFIVHHVRHAIAAAIAPRPRHRKPKDRLEYQRTDNHLSSMHDHKADTALTEAQKKKLRNQKLEERF
jgi:hypothetical protein